MNIAFLRFSASLSHIPRSARLDLPGLVQHLIVRGINRQDIFLEDGDRKHFCGRLSDLLRETETECLAWALLSNHFHLLLRPHGLPLASFMRRLLTGHAVIFNRRHHRVGKLFQNRYKSIVCEEDPYLLELVRYIHLNPLRARLVVTFDDLDEYLWSGHRVVLGKGELAGQAVDEVLVRFGDHYEQARLRYRAFVAEGVAAGQREELVGGGLRRRFALQGQTKEKESYDERILGSGEFVDHLWDHEDLRQHLRPNLTLPELVGRVARVLEIPPQQVLRQSKQPTANAARRIICYVATRELGARGTDVGVMLGLGQSGVSHAAAKGGQLWREDAALREAVLDPQRKMRDS